MHIKRALGQSVAKFVATRSIKLIRVAPNCRLVVLQSQRDALKFATTLPLDHKFCSRRKNAIGHELVREKTIGLKAETR